MRVLALYFLLVASVSAKEPAPWPKATGAKVEFTSVPAAELPEGISFDQITVEYQEPHPVGICWFDLNHDGKLELFVHSHEGGTGGPYLYIFARTHAGFRAMGGCQGSIKLVVPANGYYQIETWSSGGGGGYSRALLRFIRGRYRCVRLEEWQIKPGSNEPSLAAIRDPKRYGN